ncbi:MAG: hypothetical protein Q4B12_09200, partial [Bowdeniella nasicola]|nr:hypothetical protein [Bowdeniella nasicola]
PYCSADDPGIRHLVAGALRDGDWPAGDAVRGIVQPYDDSPFDHLLVGQDAYLNLLSTARKTVDIISPI